MSRPTLLLINVSPDKTRNVKLAAMRFQIMTKTIAETEFDLPIGSFCGLSCSLASSQETTEGQNVEEMLVMAFFPPSLVKPFLEMLRRMKCGISIKAILTETNQNWNAYQLSKELSGERDALEAGKTARHKLPAESEA